MTRIFAAYGRSLPDHYLFPAVEIGGSWAWRRDTGLPIDYGVSVNYAANDLLSVFVNARAKTFAISGKDCGWRGDVPGGHTLM